jgi:mRNA interferase MazF
MLEQTMFNLVEKYNILMNVDERDKERFQRIINWTGTMMELSVKEKYAKNVSPRRREIWTCDLGENVGSELNKVRPCLIYQNDVGNKNANTTIILPITNREERIPTHVHLTQDAFASVEKEITGTIVAEQVRAVSKSRLGRKIGELTDSTMNRVDFAVLRLCGMDTHTLIMLHAQLEEDIA